MQFIDRKAKYPGRWTMKKSDGTSEIITLIRNDEPVVEGTPMNADTLNTLSDVAGADIAKEAAEKAAENAKASQDASARSESAAATSAQNSENSASAAKTSETNAAISEANALRYSQEAGAKANTDKTLSIADAPADAKATGDALDSIMLMLVTGRLTFGLYTDAGAVLCTSDGAQLTAEKHI